MAGMTTRVRISSGTFLNCSRRSVRGGKIRKGSVNGYNDHRIVMSAAVASCFTDEEIEISDAFAVEKSYPAFFDHFISLTKD